MFNLNLEIMHMKRSKMKKNLFFFLFLFLQMHKVDKIFNEKKLFKNRKNKRFVYL